MSVTFTPGNKTALERKRRIRSAIGIVELSKYLPSGHARTLVPCALSSLDEGLVFSFSITLPSAKVKVETCPSRQTVTSNLLDSALVTETPTPCKPPENAYAPPEPFSNLPPACNWVKTISTTGSFSVGCIPTGIPRPSSSTLTLPSVCIVTIICLPKPPKASSDALSNTSWMTCKGLSVRVYIPGR